MFFLKFICGTKIPSTCIEGWSYPSRKHVQTCFASLVRETQARTESTLTDLGIQEKTVLAEAGFETDLLWPGLGRPDT